MQSPPRFVFFGIDCSTVSFKEPRSEAKCEALKFYEECLRNGREDAGLPPPGFAEFMGDFIRTEIFTEPLITALKEMLTTHVDATEFGATRRYPSESYNSTWMGFTFSACNGMLKDCSVSFMAERTPKKCDDGEPLDDGELLDGDDEGEPSDEDYDEGREMYESAWMEVRLVFGFERISLKIPFDTDLVTRVSHFIPSRTIHSIREFLQKMTNASDRYVYKSVTCDSVDETMKFEKEMKTGMLKKMMKTGMKIKKTYVTIDKRE